MTTHNQGIIKALDRLKTVADIRYKQWFQMTQKEDLIFAAPRVLFVSGSTGSGKTYTITEWSRKNSILYVKINGAEINPTSSKDGINVNDIKTKIIQKLQSALAQGKVGSLEGGSFKLLLWIDEADKLAEIGTTSSKWQVGVQHELLTLLEGVEINVMGIVLSGSFSATAEVAVNKKVNHRIGFFNGTDAIEDKQEVEEDFRDFLEKSGFISEFAGRVSELVKTDNLTVDIAQGFVDAEIERVNEQLNRLKLEILDKNVYKVTESMLKYGFRSVFQNIEFDKLERFSDYNGTFENDMSALIAPSAGV